jgi:tetratricopeptide (TPR) repeat protein
MNNHKFKRNEVSNELLNTNLEISNTIHNMDSIINDIDNNIIKDNDSKTKLILENIDNDNERIINSISKHNDNEKVDEVIKIYEDNTKVINSMNDTEKEVLLPIVISSYLKRWRFIKANDIFEEFSNLNIAFDDKRQNEIDFILIQLDFYKQYYKNVISKIESYEFNGQIHDSEIKYILANSEYGINHYRKADILIQNLIDTYDDSNIDYSIIVKSYILLANIQYEKRDFNKAIKTMDIAYDKFKENKDLFDLIPIYLSFGKFYSRVFLNYENSSLISKKYDEKAIDCLEIVISEYESKKELHSLISDNIYEYSAAIDAYYYLGLLNYILNSIESSDNYFKISLNMINNLQNHLSHKKTKEFDRIIRYYNDLEYRIKGFQKRQN